MLIVISNPTDLDNESDILNTLFSKGLQTLHLRKTGGKREDYEKLLKDISPENKKKVVLHQYHELATKYNIKGLHLKEDHRKKLNLQELKSLKREMKNKNLTFSTSFHSIEDIDCHDGLFDYVFLSPVFESISKPGHVSETLFKIDSKKNETKIIALGGVQSNNIEKVKELGFDGIAVLGAVWQNTQTAEAQFLEIKNQYSKHFTNSLIH